MKRGDVLSARLDPTEGNEQAGTRPVLVVSRDIMNDLAPYVIALPITTFRGRPLGPSHVLLKSGEAGLRVDSVVLCEQIRLLSTSRLGRRWGTITPESLLHVNRALMEILDLR